MVSRRQFLSAATALGTDAFCSLRAVALEAGEPSRTAQSAALHRAAHQLLETPLIFEDPLSLKILGPERRRLLELNLPRHRRYRSRAMRAFIVTRSRYAEDELARALGQGTDQYVILGAGLDTFAYRNPHGAPLKVFEVDHPSTQAWKQKQLHDHGIDVPRSLSFVAVDFEKDALADRLQSSGFRFETPAFIAWLGVTMYLTREAVMQTLRFVAHTCARGSEIVFDFGVPDELLSEGERALRGKRAENVAKIGEPWISYFDPNALADDLLAMGFSRAGSFGASEANARYFTGRNDGFLAVGSGRIMHAHV